MTMYVEYHNHGDSLKNHNPYKIMCILQISNQAAPEALQLCCTHLALSLALVTV